MTGATEATDDELLVDIDDNPGVFL